MPRYYFHLEVAGDITPDEDGHEFASVQVAKEEAVAVASEVAQNKTSAELGRQFLLLVDEEGTLISRTPLFTRSQRQPRS